MFKVQFADIGEGLTEGKVIEVLVKVGDVVKAGDSLFSVETDKVNAEIPAPVAGKITSLLIKPNQNINVGDVVAEIATDGKEAVAPSEPPKEGAEEENASVVGATPVSNTVIPSRKPPEKSTTTSSKAVPTNLKVEKSYDVIVVGAGIGGYFAAVKAARFGLKTLIVEKEYYGGVCLNVGCIPTKSLLKTAKTYSDLITKAATLGINIPQAPTIDWTQAQKRKSEVVYKLTHGVEGLLEKNKVEQIMGTAKAIDQNHLEVNGKIYSTKYLIIATGAIPNTLPLPGFEEARKKGVMIDSTGILNLKTVPKTLTIIGGGVIGVEFACLFAGLGTKVTIVQALPTILEMFDRDIIDLMTKELQTKFKIEIILNAKVVEMKNQELFYEVDGQPKSIKSDYVLEAVGRKVALTGFENIGLTLTDRKAIAVNDRLETNLEGVYAIGDVTGKTMLAHAASHAGLVAANHIGLKENKPTAEPHMVMRFDRVPSCVYTFPEVAVIGKTEQELKAAGIAYKAYKFPFIAIGKALADDSTTGFTKIIIEPEYGEILGAHMVGNRVTEIISEIAAVMECEGTIDDLVGTIHPHPTMSEAIGEVAEALKFGRAINI